MALARTCRNIVHRLLPQTKSNWQWLETTLMHVNPQAFLDAGFEEAIRRSETRPIMHKTLG